MADAPPSAIDHRVESLSARVRETLIDVFGQTSLEYREFLPSVQLDKTRYVEAMDSSGRVFRRANPGDIAVGVQLGCSKSALVLEAKANAMEEGLGYSSSSLESRLVSLTNEVPVFIVHGHDEKAKTLVSFFLTRAGLEPIVLHEQPDSGQTINEKFEKHGTSAGFAIILLTPDDVGGLTPEQLAPRARQNVIGEMFWFAGRLGRNRVWALRKGDVEVPSDFAGVGYVAMDEAGAWKHELLKELEAAGYEVNWRNALV